MIGQGNGWLPQFLGSLGDIVNPAIAVEERAFRMDVQIAQSTQGISYSGGDWDGAEHSP